jgi:hypothetical protein
MPSPHEVFTIRSLFDIRYLSRRLRTMRSPGDLAVTVKNLAILAGKIGRGRYGRRYWDRQKLQRGYQSQLKG